MLRKILLAIMIAWGGVAQVRAESQPPIAPIGNTTTNQPAGEKIKKLQLPIPEVKKEPEETQEAEVYYQRGKKQEELKNYQAALNNYNKGIEIDPNNVLLYMYRGSLRYFHLKDYQGALDDHDKIISLEHKEIELYRDDSPFNNLMRESKVSRLSSTYMLRGDIKFILKDLSGAIADYDKAIELPIDEKVTNFLHLSYSSRASFKFHQLKDYQGAIADYDMAIANAPSTDNEIRSTYLTLRSEIKGFKLKDYKSAIADINAALKYRREVSAASLYGYRSELKKKMGDKQGAKSDFNRSIQLYRKQGNIDGYQKEVIKSIQIIESR